MTNPSGSYPLLLNPLIPLLSYDGYEYFFGLRGSRSSSFYYVDERDSNGGPMYKGVTDSAHADVFLKLAQSPEQGPWQYTFTKENGYAAFSKDWA